MPHSLRVHRQHQMALRKALLAGLPNLIFRDVPDNAGDIGDALVFFLDTEAQAQTVARRLFEKEGIMLKNLPDALNWHYAGNWHHLLGRQADTLERSGKLLRRAVAIQICYRWDEAAIKQTADAIVAAVKEAS
jgi:8-amino-3,8-dideoxy-alpha-D-manno-octulosonate transaminase